MNLATDEICRRCGDGFGRYASPRSQRVGPRDAAKRSSWLYTLLFIALIGGGFYYLYNGVLRSYEQIQAEEANRFVKQPKQTPAPQTSRTESDQRRTELFKNAIQNSQGIAASDKRQAETQKLIQPNAGSPQK
jgi:hypothetical protein